LNQVIMKFSIGVFTESRSKCCVGKRNISNIDGNP